MTTIRPDTPPRDAADRFIDGEDRLSELLRALPRYEAPASLAVAVTTAARAVQARMAAEAERGADQHAARASEPAPAFTAPATLADVVQREAAKMQSAQSARRDVVFDHVAQGKPAADVLGARVSDATEAWLRTQATAHREATAPAAPARRHARLSRWWRSLGVAATAFAVAGLAAKIVLSQLDDGTPTTASLSSNVIIADTASPAPVAAPAAQSAPPSPAGEARVAQAAPEALANSSSEPPSESSSDALRGASRAPLPERAAPKAEAMRRPTTPSPAARKESAPAPAVASTADRQPAPVAPPAVAPYVAPPAAPPALSAMQAQADAAPASAFAPPPPPAPAPSYAAPAVAAEARVRRMPQAALLASPAPAGSPAGSPAASKAAVASAESSSGSAKESAAERSATVTLEDDPASVAMQWRPGKSLHVWSAEPDNAAVRDWVARLWAAMPTDARPAAPYGVQRDDALPRGQLRIEQTVEKPAGK